MLLSAQNGQQIEFTQGDTVALSLIATDDAGNPVDLTGASLSTQILGPNGVGSVTFPNGQHTLGDQTTNPGTFVLDLSTVNTAACNEGDGKQIITQAVISGVITYFRGINLLSVNVNVPLQ